MTKQSNTYLEQKLDGRIVREDDTVKFTFQRAKMKLNDQLEINMLKAVHPEIIREFTLTEDQLIISFHFSSAYHQFDAIYEKSMQSKWQFAYNLLKKVENHTLNRFMLVVCPDNILFDQGLQPHFLHYGVKESIPPYEKNPERLWEETKATIATIVDQKYDFESYLLHHETLKLSPIAKQIMEAENAEQLAKYIEENLKKNEAYEKTTINIPQKKWKVSRYSILALVLVLIPTLIYTIYAVFFKIPQTEAYVDTNRYFLQNEYSSVIDELAKYDPEQMPYVVQYQLATSYLAYESLDEAQRNNILNSITLQSDRRYFSYWIDIGRGNYEEAIDTARMLEARDLIMYGLLKQREAVKVDQSLSGEEREQQVKAINDELQVYQAEMEEEQKQLEEQEAEDNVSSDSEEQLEIEEDLDTDAPNEDDDETAEDDEEENEDEETED